jgi:hypothetical protein
LRDQGQDGEGHNTEDRDAGCDACRGQGAPGPAFVQPGQPGGDVFDTGIGGGVEASAERAGLGGSGLGGEAEQAEVPVGQVRGSGIQLLQPGKPATPHCRRLVHQPGHADAVGEVLTDQQPVQRGDRFVKTAAAGRSDLITGVDRCAFPRCDKEVQHVRQPQGIDGDVKRLPRQGFDFQRPEVGGKDEVQLRAVTRFEEIGHEVSVHQEGPRAEEAGQQDGLAGVAGHEDLDWPGVTHLPFYVLGCSAQNRECLRGDLCSSTEQLRPENLLDPPDRSEDHDQGRREAADRQKTGQAQHHEQPGPDKQNGC